MIVLDAFGRDAERCESFLDRLDHFALPLLSHHVVEAGIEDDGAGRSNDRPDIEVERLQNVVRIAKDVVFSRFAFVVAVANGIDLVRVVAHRAFPLAPFRSLPAFKPASCAGST